MVVTNIVLQTLLTFKARAIMTKIAHAAVAVS